MKIRALLWVVLLPLAACQPQQQDTSRKDAVMVHDSLDQTNDFYDNEETVVLPGTESIEICGEVKSPGFVKLDQFPMHSVIVKETRLNVETVEFVGAYRYDGVSVSELLSSFVLEKLNTEEFNPIIDLYVVVYGKDGDSVVLSWGELFYPVHRHEILIAGSVMRIVPGKTKDLWPLPTYSKLIVPTDLITERNISNPVKMEVKSIRVDYTVNRDIKMWAPEMKIKKGEQTLMTLDRLPDNLVDSEFDQVFYGRGRGIHGISTFKGSYLKDLMADMFPMSRQEIKTRLFAIAAVDGYRCSMTWSELCNRNDRVEVYIIDEENYEDAGRFSCLFSADFFSDRAIKSITEIRSVNP